MVLGVVGARLLLPLAIPRFPLPAVLLCLVLDAGDQTIFQSWTDIDLSGYQLYDKALDVHYLTIAYLATIRNWGGGPDHAVGKALWYYRLVGVVLFEFVGARWLLLVFPNTFEYFFIALEGYKTSRNPNRFGLRTVVVVAAAIWVGIKLPQEWWIHVAQLDVTDFVGDHLSTPGLVALLAAVIAVVAALAVVAHRRLPPPDWPATVDADRQGLELGWRLPRREARPNAFFGWSFVEKVLLVTLVSAIFGRMLPGVDAELIETFAVVTFVIFVNTVLSQLLARRGVTWRTTGIQFATMFGANIATVLGYAALFDETDEATFGQVAFLTGLLTLIVVLYDRYQAIEDEREHLPAGTPLTLRARGVRA